MPGNFDGLGLPGEGWQIFAGAAGVRRRRDEAIYRQGEDAACFYYLRAGRVKVFLSSPEGTEKALAVHGPGAVFGEAAFFDGMPRTTSARALEDCVLVPVDHGLLLEAFAHEPDLAMRLLRYLARTVRMLSAQVDAMTFLQADRRIARLLAQLARPDGEGLRVAVPQEELATLAGVSRVTVGRVLGQFVRGGWVKTGYRGVRVLDIGALERFAGGGV